MVGVQGVVADVSGSDAEDRYSGGLGDLLFQAVQVGVNGFRFPAGVGEYRVVDRGKDALGGKGEESAGLNSSAQRKGAESGLI
ncbi:hypothetical protein BKA18_005493 [Streptomyces auratus]